MPDQTQDLTAGERSFDELLAECIAAEDAGQPLDRQALLARHPRHAAELREFFANRDTMLRLTAPLQSGLPAGRHFGDYEIVETIAHGGMGVVYKARQISLQRIVALKTIRAGQAVSPEEEQRFLSEAAAVARLDHPNIVPIFQVGRDAGELFFTMGFVEGSSLQRQLEAAPLAAREAAACLSKVAGAVAYAHAQGVIHRDLKPSNILIDRDGEPKVTDFGLAKHIHHDSSLTATGQVLGTPGYMPPEQASGMGKEVTESADVYALGATLYCLLTRRPPFAAASPAATLVQVLEQDPLRPRLLAPDVPRDLETICLKCLDKDPRRRYHTALDLKDDLDRFLRDEPIRARPAGPGELAWRWCRRNPRLAGLAAALAVAVVVGVSGIAWQWRRTLAEMATNQHRLFAAHMSLSARDAETDNLAPVLQRLRAYEPKAGQSDLRSFEWYYLWRQCHREQRTVEVPTKHHVLAMSLAPTGKWLAIAELRDPKSQAIQIVDVATSRVARSIPLSQTVRAAELAHLLPELAQNKADESITISYRPDFLKFSPDGQWLAAYCDTVHYYHGHAGGSQTHHRLAIWDVASGRQVGVMDVERDVEHLALSHDRSTLAMAYHYPDPAETWDVSKVLGGGKPSRLTVVEKMRTSGLKMAFSPDGKVLAGATSGDTVTLCDVRTGAVLGELSRKASWTKGETNTEVAALAFSPDGQFVAVRFGTTNALTVWERATGEEIMVARPDPRAGMGRRSFETIAFSPDSRRLALACGQIIKVFDLAERREIARLRGHSTLVAGLAFDGDGERLVSLAHQSGLGWATPGELKHWRLDDLLSPGKSITTLGRTVAVSPHGNLLAIPRGPEVHLVDAATQNELLAIRTPPPANQLAGHNNDSHLVAFSQDGRRLAIAGNMVVRTAPKDANIHVIGGSSGKTMGQLWTYDLDAHEGEWSARLADARDLDDPATGLAFLDDGRVVAGDQRRAEIVNPVTKSSQFVPPDREDWSTGQSDQRGWVGGMASDGRGAVVVLQFGRGYHVWNGVTGRLIGRAKYDERCGIPMLLTSMAVSPDGRWLATCHTDLAVRIWDLQRPRQLLVRPAQVVTGHDGIVTALGFHPDGKTLITGGADGLVKVWDIVTGDERLTLRAHHRPISCLAISADGTTVVSAVSGAHDGEVKVWRAASKSEVQQHKTEVVTSN